MKAFKTLGLALLFMAFQNCSSIYYPTYPVLPDTKGEGVGVHIAGGPTRGQASLWYTKDSNVYALGTLGYANANGFDESSNGNFNALSGQVGLGYKKLVTPKLELQIQGGGGLCSGRYFATNVFTLQSNTSFITPDVSAISKRAYIAPIFGFINKNKGTFYILSRITYETYSNIRQTNFDPTQSSNPAALTKQFNMLYGELYGVGRIDARALNIDIMFGWAGTMKFLIGDDNNILGTTNYVQPFMFGIGLSRTFKL